MELMFAKLNCKCLYENNAASFETSSMLHSLSIHYIAVCTAIAKE